ncbi:MAG: PAS domain-containing protein, partial [Balneolales bacterium]|nr:PAS domain-containing protein [Balneolales bacterium]
STDYLLEQFPDAELLFYEDELAAMVSTAFGQADAVLINIYSAAYLIEKYGLVNLVMGSPSDFEWEFRFGVIKEHPELISQLNDVILSLTEDVRNSIFKSTYSLQFPEKPSFWEQNLRLILGVFIFLNLLLAFIFLTNRRLKTLIKQAVIKQKEADMVYKYAVKASFDILIDVDLLKKRFTFEGSGVNHFGLNDVDEHVVFDKWHNRIHPADKRRVLVKLNRSLASGENHFADTFRCYNDSDEINWLEVRVYFNHAGDGRVDRVIGAIRDISERINYLRAIERQNAKLKEIAWMQSHEIRGPASRILALIDEIYESRELDSDTKELIGYIGEAVKEIDDVIHEVVNKSKGI